MVKYLGQILYILAFTLAGEALHAVIPLPIPASIYGMILLFLALCTGLLKEEKIADLSHWMISFMPVLLVAPSVSILEHWGIIAPKAGQILIITVVSTIVVFLVCGILCNLLLKKKHQEDTDHD